MNYKGTMLILFSSVFLIAGCTDEAVTTEQKKVVKTTTHTDQKTNQTKHPILNPVQYEKLFKHMDEHLKMDQFQLKRSTIGADFTAVDQSLSFGKRRWLTVDGTIDTSSTQEALYFENQKQDTQLAIHFAYTDRYIGNDLIQYQSNGDYGELLIISYKNILISVQHNYLQKVDSDTTQEAAKQVIHELKNVPV
ncbi:hypothetical protein [Exiguobacterium acetylicum]|uniref:hypothetical protein n=2 Tax=Exiguobacterium TaxID=33986 RepID=UPI0004941464|nr:hypothetical protein [Exiguobacterium acetylicum]HCD58842.1 hypothetical protein [Exiguobacterium sp.]